MEKESEDKNEIRVFIEVPLNDPIEILIAESSSIGNLKDIINTQINIKKKNQTLIHFGEILTDDSKSLLQYNVLDSDVITVIKIKVIKVFIIEN